MGEKVSMASTGWVVMFYDKTSTIIKGWWMYTTNVGSLEDNNEISEYDNLFLDDYGVMSLIVVVTEFMSLKDVMDLI